MLILHAGEDDGYLLLWSEAPADPTQAPRPRVRSRKRHPEPVPYPYDGGAIGLAQAFILALPGQPLPGGGGPAPFLWAPTIKGVPVPSSGLIGNLPAPGTPAELAPYTVTTLRLPTSLAIDLLCHCIGKERLADGVLIGSNLAFWARALRLAGALTVREQIVPGLRRNGAGWKAFWQPVLVGPEGQRVTRLAQTMPPACRAFERSAESPPDRSPVAVLTSFLDVTVDALVRLALAEPDRSTGRVQVPVESFPSLHDQWVHALRSSDGLITGPERELAALAEQVRAWQRPITVTASTSFQLCFRLEEPSEAVASGSEEEASGEWRVAREEEEETQGPSVGVPAEAGPSLPSPESPAPEERTGRRGRRRRRRKRDGASASALATRHSPLATGSEEAGAWRIRYLLQARDDPSLLIPVADAWKPSGQVAALFAARNFASREYLLTTLGQAAGLCPPIEGSLASAAPSGFTTDATGAHRFLTEHAWLLEQAGFPVMLPAWWTGKDTRARLRAQALVHSSDSPPPGFTSGAGLSMQQLVAFDWKVALGDEPLDLAELEALARLKVPLVRIRGQWVQIHPDEIQALLALMKKRQAAQATLRQVVQMALGGGQAPGGLPFGGVSAQGWVAEFLAQLEGREPFSEQAVPEGFEGTLRPYQVRGYSWLAFLRRWGMGACLADDMGLGKTIQTLALVLRDWQITGRPTLLICPTSVVANWAKEAQRFTPELPVMVHHGVGRARGTHFGKTAGRFALVLSSYALLFRDQETFRQVEWSGVVLDEAQNIKNPETKQAQAARSLPADFRIALTGTPVENHVGDLWSIFEFLTPGWLGSQADFRRRFLIPIQARQDAEAANRLKRLTGPFLLRRLKTDKSVIADLPDKLEMKVFCTLTREQATLYAAVVKEINDALESSEGMQRRGLILATLTRLKQVCNHPAQFLQDGSGIAGRSGKLARLTEMLEEVLETGERALVFTQFKEMGDLLQKHLQETFGREVLFLHGGVARAQRTTMVERFQSDPAGPRVFLLSLKAGGTGLNLTAANHVFHFDRWWNPAVEDQATDRAFRIGQQKNVQVHKFVCVGTLEEKIDEMITRKQQVASRVVGTGENWLTEMSNDQLRELWALRQEAIEED
jgi:SNF2 family DNA or RNA helicase